MAVELKLETVTPKKVLIIVAHPDDIEFGSGGSVAAWTDAGAEVVYVIVTNGASGSNEATMMRDTLIPLREAEQNAAAAIVGVHDVRYLGYPDGTLQPTLELRRDLTRIIRETKPDRVVIMDPTTVLIQQEDFDYINHPDHRAAGEAALYAVFPSSETRPIFPELLAEGLEPHKVRELYFNIPINANVAVDISEQIDRKIRSLLCHKSQIGEEVVEMVKGWSARSGQEVGVPFAETFRVMRLVRDEMPPPPADAASTDETETNLAPHAETVPA